MKTTIAILGILLGLTFQAEARNVAEGSELTTYKDAVVSYLEEKNLDICARYWDLKDLVKKSQSLEISEGEQPLMTFSMQTTQHDYRADLIQVVITTDSSFKEIKAMKVQTFNKGKVNDGTLKDPVLRDGYSPIYNGSRACN